MQIIGFPGKIEINIVDRSNKTATDFWDANWLQAEITIHTSGFKAHYITNIRTDELERLYEELIKLEKLQIKEARFSTIEEGLYIVFTLLSNGIIQVIGRANDGDGNILEFKFNAESSSINNFARQLKKTLDLYPVIGESK